MTTPDSLSPEAQIKAAATLARSGALTMIMRWALMIGVPAVTGLGGWIVAKVETKTEIAELRQAISELARQQAQLTARIDAAVPQLQKELTGVKHDVVVATGAALAYETEKRGKEKLAAGINLGRSFTGYVQRGEEASVAKVVAEVAVPHVAR